MTLLSSDSPANAPVGGPIGGGPIGSPMGGIGATVRLPHRPHQRSALPVARTLCLALMLSGVGAIGTLSGCANYIGIHSDKRTTDVTQLDTQQSLPAEGGQWPAMDWAARFGDPQLSKLVDEALANSPSIAEAQARLNQAAAYTGGADATRFPTVGAQYSLKRELYSGNALYPPPFGGSWYTENNVGLNASYDLDLWGKHGAELAQAISQERASAAEAQEARLTLATSIAMRYSELAREYALLDVAKAETQQRVDIGRISADRFNAGLDTQLESRTSEAQISSSRTQVSQIEGSIVVTRYQLGTLLGKGPDRGLAIAKPQLSAIADMTLPDALPANLLSRRPDIVAARWRVDAATHGIDAGKAAFYPNINLSAAAGFDAFGFGRFLQFGSRQYQVGPAINLPIFDAGALRAQLKGNYATFDTAVAQYNDTLIRSLTDVATQVVQIRSIEGQQRDAQAAYGAAQKAYQLAVIRYKAGLSTQLQVLDADRTLLQQEEAVVTLSAQRRDQQIGLIKALGGGFTTASAVPVSAQAQLKTPTNIQKND